MFVRIAHRKRLDQSRRADRSELRQRVVDEVDATALLGSVDHLSDDGGLDVIRPFHCQKTAMVYIFDGGCLAEFGIWHLACGV